MVTKSQPILECSRCGAFTKVSSDQITGIICSECVTEMLREFEGPTQKKSKFTAANGYPKGWRFMKEFVHIDGTVYFKGAEQPELKGTYDATVIVAKPKKSKAQKAQEVNDALTKLSKLKTSLKRTTKKGEIKKLQIQIKKLEKQVK